jgi:hypothetical protein
MHPSLDLQVPYAEHCPIATETRCEEKPATEVAAGILATHSQINVARGEPTILARIGGLRAIKEGPRLQRYRQGV